MRDEGSWDIKTSVGSTALFVAAARGLAARRPDPIAVDRFAEVFCVAAGGEWGALFTGDPAEHPLYTTDFGIPFQDFQAARTRYLDDYCAAAAAAGVRQIVILAAGLDARAYRLPWPDGTVVYELDQPLVLQFKRTVLDEHGDEPTALRREVPIDLRTDWPAALRNAGFDPGAPAAWLVEGLLIYLSPTEQDLVYERIESLSAPGSFVGIEQMRTIDPATYRTMLDDSDNRNRVQWASLIHNEPHADAVEWFGRYGWTGAATNLSDLLAELGRPTPPADFLMPELVSLVTLKKR